MGGIIIDRESTVQKIELENVEEVKSEYSRSTQSANVLMKFMKKIDYLKEIINRQAIAPRYYEESIEYLEINSLNKIAFPMVCFCDINLSKLTEHVAYYGKFGIALTKDWGMRQGIQPIHYINKNSNIKKDMSYLFSNAINNNLEDNLEENNDISEYKNYLLAHLLFMKPVSGKMRREGGYDNRNFTDEKEWRYVPHIKEEHGIELIIEERHLENDTAYNSYSEGIAQIDELCLQFELRDIEYLMVENEADRNELIEFIIESIDIEMLDKYTLISKIIVYDIMNKDW